MNIQALTFYAQTPQHKRWRDRLSVNTWHIIKLLGWFVVCGIAPAVVAWFIDTVGVIG